MLRTQTPKLSQIQRPIPTRKMRLSPAIESEVDVLSSAHHALAPLYKIKR